MIGVYIQIPNLSPTAYTETNGALMAAGVTMAGLKLHTAFVEGEGIAVFDVWESRADYETFVAEASKTINGFESMLTSAQFVEMLDLVTP